ncbi:hypothetical protein ACFVMA_18715 [Streptomyces rochei]|uniref:hypothetical protein n=1 Tax=Streptomyces rochei TaxID=1928 RepID=UPI0036CC73FB
MPTDTISTTDEAMRYTADVVLFAVGHVLLKSSEAGTRTRAAGRCPAAMSTSERRALSPPRASSRSRPVSLFRSRT